MLCKDTNNCTYANIYEHEILRFQSVNQHFCVFYIYAANTKDVATELSITSPN